MNNKGLSDTISLNFDEKTAKGAALYVLFVTDRAKLERQISDFIRKQDLDPMLSLVSVSVHTKKRGVTL